LKFRISSTGFYVPPDIETAEDLSARVGRSVEWIRSRTGVEHRHVARIPDGTLLGAEAARQALGDGPPPDLVINGSGLPRQVIPDNSTFLLDALGLEGIPCFTVHATCLSFLVGLKVATSMLGASFSRILLVSAEVTSVGRDFNEPESCVLLGDGASAAVIYSANDQVASELLFWDMETWPSGADLATVKGGGTLLHPNRPDAKLEEQLFHMSGPRIYRFAREKVEGLLQKLWNETGLSASDIDLVVPHQASGPALAALPRYGFPEEKIVNIVGEYGNCVAASLPMALHVALDTGRIHKGDKVLLIGTGAGLSVAAALLRW